MKVSIIVPSYNSKRFISSSIDSILSQTHTDIECIVVDGGSIDGTVEVLKSYGDKIYFISEEDHGVFDALNKGIKIAKGAIIGWMGADDFYAHPGVVKKAVQALEIRDVDICWGDLQYTERENPDKIIRYWKSNDYKKGAYRNGWQMPHFSSFLKKEIFEVCGYFRLDLKIAADYEFFLRVLEIYNLKTAYIPEVFLKMRTGGQSNFSWQGNIECYRAWALNGIYINPIKIFMPKVFIKIKQFIYKK